MARGIFSLAGDFPTHPHLLLQCIVFFYQSYVVLVATLGVVLMYIMSVISFVINPGVAMSQSYICFLVLIYLSNKLMVKRLTQNPKI